MVGWVVLDSRALTKIRSVALIAIIVVAAVGGGAGYVLWRAGLPPPEDIKIGICADLDMSSGKSVYQAALLAAEQVNAEGGVLGRNITIVAEDDDDEMLSIDIRVVSNAMTKLITVDKADYVVTNAIGVGVVFPLQDICAEHKKICFSVRAIHDNITQRVIDNYERYKYFFKFGGTNQTTSTAGLLGDILALANYTGFTKIAFLGHDFPAIWQTADSLANSLPKHGLNLVYSKIIPVTTTDFTSYFAAVEAAGAEILVPSILNQAFVSLVKEWYDRQSPCIIYGALAHADKSDFWDMTEGKCEYVSFASVPVEYPLTNYTIPTRTAYLQRWGTVPSSSAVAAYDGIRFILPDALRRAGTTETEALIKTLETTDVETSLARHFVFTSSHDLMVGGDSPNNPAEDYVLVAVFQWQANKTQVLVKPEQLMKEAGATFKYPPWTGPWNSKQTS